MQRNELIEAIINYDVLDCAIKYHVEKLEQAITTIIEGIELLTSGSDTYVFLKNLKDTLLSSKLMLMTVHDPNALELYLKDLEIPKHIKSINIFVFSTFPNNKKIFFDIEAKLNSIKTHVNNIIKFESERIILKRNIESLAPKYAGISHEDRIEHTETYSTDGSTRRTLRKISVYPLHLSSQPDAIYLLLLNGANPNQCGYAKLPRTKELISRYKFNKYDSGINEYRERLNDLKTSTVFNNFLCFSSDYYERFQRVPPIVSACIEHDYQKAYTLASLNNIAKFKMSPNTIRNAITAIMHNSWITEHEAQSMSPERKEWNDTKLATLKLLIDLLDARQLLTILYLDKASNFNKDHHKIAFLKSAYANKIQLTTWNLLSAGHGQRDSLLHHVPHEILKFIMSISMDLDKTDFSYEKITFFTKVYSIMRDGDTLISSHDFLHHHYNKSDDELMCLLLGKMEYEPDSMTTHAWKLTGKHYTRPFTKDNTSLVDDFMNWYISKNWKYNMLNTSLVNTFFHDSLAERQKTIRAEISDKIDKLNQKMESQMQAYLPVPNL